MKKHYIIFLLCATLIMACATSPTGRRQLMLVSEDSAIAASKQAYVEMLKPYAQQGKIDNDPVLKDRVYRITGRLIKHKGIEVVCQDHPEPDYFSFSGRIFLIKNADLIWPHPILFSSLRCHLHYSIC